MPAEEIYLNAILCIPCCAGGSQPITVAYAGQRPDIGALARDLESTLTNVAVSGMLFITSHLLMSAFFGRTEDALGFGPSLSLDMRSLLLSCFRSGMCSASLSLLITALPQACLQSRPPLLALFCRLAPMNLSRWLLMTRALALCL